LKTLPIERPRGLCSSSNIMRENKPGV